MTRLFVEEKHTYNSSGLSIHGNISRNEWFNLPGTFISYEPVYPVQGTDEDDRIGRKINSRFISEEGFLTLNMQSTENSLLDYWSRFVDQEMSTLQPQYEFPVSSYSLSIPIRHLVVEFSDEAFYKATYEDKAVYLQRWFEKLYIQSGLFTIPSNTMHTLRESTEYTGRFNILKDDIYWLDMKEKHTVHFQYKLPYKRTINFDAAGSDPTNIHVFSVWIGPTNSWLDYNNRTFGAWLDNTEDITATPTVCHLDVTMKLVYTDI